MRATVKSLLVRIVSCYALAIALPPTACAQDLLQYFDLTSDEFTKSDMTRAEIEAALAKLPDGETLDLAGKRLNKLDLSHMDLSRTKLNAARINGCNFRSAKIGDPWTADVVVKVAPPSTEEIARISTGAKFIGASLFQTQMMDAKLDGADFSNAMVGADMSRASLVDARFQDAMLAPDLTNQSMGLMRGVLKSAKLDGHHSMAPT